MEGFNHKFKSNFNFLEDNFSILSSLATAAEYNLYSDPIISIIKLRQFGERITEILYSEHGLAFPYENTFHNRLKILEYEHILPHRVKELLFTIKSKGNIAAHDNKGTIDDAKTVLFSAFKIAKWIEETYGTTEDLDNLKYKLPPNLDVRHALSLLEGEYVVLEQKFNQLIEEREIKEISKTKADEIKNKAEKAASKIEMNEAETRELIDEQLRIAGWEADTKLINYKIQKTLPEKGRNMAIAEWRVGVKYADYALFIDTKFIGVVEAKKWGVDISSDLTQSKRYAENANEIHDISLLGQWGIYKVPFLFSTNGRPFIEQLKHKSGVWFWDARNAKNHSRSLEGWYSPDGLLDLYEKDFDKAIDDLKKDDFEYLKDKNGLSLYDFQVEAIKAVEEKLLNNPKDRRALVAMATGTGKTRTIIGLSYRFIKSNRFKRILFLVDRTTLGTQAINAYTDNKIEDLNTFADIYKVNELVEKIPESDTRLHFATVQGMVQRLFYSSDNEFSVDDYDCIIVDEAHRGYLLDKELGEEEFKFKDQTDYVSKYRKVLSFFDAYAIGLTATPAIHTIEIFGEPVFNFTYREAVLGGYLVDFEPPYLIKTELNQKGINWRKGALIKVYDKEDNTIKDLTTAEDDIHVDVTGFNKKVITPKFNEVVVSVLARELDPEGDEKTLIFAANNDHADMVVDLLKKEYQKLEYDISENAILKITGSIYDPQTEITRFKKEKYPNIVVTVDLLTTGIDVPPITNLVFIRNVRSRILYEQMLGRATRLCPDIGKEVFRIYDAVDIYRNLEDYTNVKPVVKNVKTTFTQLVSELENIESDDRKKIQLEQIIAKLQRKKGLITGKHQDKFKYLSGDKEPEDIIEELKQISSNGAVKEIIQLSGLWKFLDELKASPKSVLYSEHEDVLMDVERGYGNGVKPEDYLESFREFVKYNQNKIAALQIVCTKPQDLDRESLKKLRLELDEHGFTRRQLNLAWKETKNEDIVADIISLIRTMSLGTNLISHEDRIKNAVDKIRNSKQWTRVQENWLNKIESQLLKETVLRKEDFNTVPFKNDGGFNRLNKIFEDRLEAIIDQINENLYIETA